MRNGILTTEQITKLQKDKKRGMSASDIMGKYNIKKTTYYKALKAETDDPISKKNQDVEVIEEESEVESEGEYEEPKTKSKSKSKKAQKDEEFEAKSESEAEEEEEEMEETEVYSGDEAPDYFAGIFQKKEPLPTRKTHKEKRSRSQNSENHQTQASEKSQKHHWTHDPRKGGPHQ